MAVGQPRTRSQPQHTVGGLREERDIRTLVVVGWIGSAFLLGFALVLVALSS
jgi:hypothetical protein